MIKRLIILIIAVVTLSSMVPAKPSYAATISLTELAAKAMYHQEQKISGYQDVEKTGYKTVEKTGYHDVEVEKTGYREVVKYRTETVTKQVPYTKTIPVYGWVVTDYFAKKGSVILTTPKLNDHNDIEVRTINKWYTAASIDKETKLTKVSDHFGKALVEYTTYGDVYKTTYIYTAKISTQAYIKQSTISKLTAANSYGKKYNVQVSKNSPLKKVNTSWFQATIKYINYVKVRNKWIKQTKTATVFIPSKYVKTTTQTTKVWTRQTKKVNGYFYLDTDNTRTVSAYKQVGNRTETGYNTVTETIQVPYTEQEPYTYTEVESQPYTYTEQEPYTYTEQEPIYETVNVENSTQEKYKAITNFYWQYTLTLNQLLSLFDLSKVTYTLNNGYDKSRIVMGSISINGSTTFYSFTPSTPVKLIVFDDGTAINLSYLTTVYNKHYDDVNINGGSYTVY
ncbi:hypothetical protein [Neobacillus vireti]|uniref:hypothetical protein n=1 Tax=Neobacillus vireti TaxID=220686 RepID=UPI002FFDD314